MRKILLSGLIISLALGFTACKSENENNKNIMETKKELNVGDKSNKEKQYIYGKVKGVVGNEIEFELANKPEKDVEEVEKEKLEELEDEKGEIPAGVMTPSMEASDEQKVNVGDIEKNEPLVELKFTGKSKDIIIPTGAQINILTNKSGEGLSVIKEGTYLRLEVDDNKSENPTVVSVDVIS